MPKDTPEQRFAKIFARFTSGATEDERAAAERKMDRWLKDHGKTRLDIPALLAKAYADDLAAQPPPPPTDPRDDTSALFDPKRHNLADLVEGIVKVYVTMTEHVRVIYVLWIIATHVYQKFSVAPRIALVSERPDSGKSTALELARLLVFRPNEEALATGAAVRDFLSEGPGTVMLDELDHADREAQQRLREIWDIGHKKRGSKKSLIIKGRRKLVDFYAPMMVAGVGLLRNFLAPQQQSRAYMLEMATYTEETKPGRNFYVEGELDIEAFNSIYSLIRRWAAEAELNPNPAMPAGVVTRYADNMRGLLSIADNCGPEWGKRAREAMTFLLTKERAEHPKVVILRHAIVICETLELERIPSLRMNKELRRLDLADANWNRYRGPSGGEYVHALTMSEQTALLKESGIEPKPMRPLGGGRLFRGYERSWFVEALRKYEPAAATPHLRLITPRTDGA
jgi:hypothetical protein